MPRVLFLLICAVCFSPALRAQKTQGEIACHSEGNNNVAHKKKLWDGYEISLGGARDPEAVEEKCTAAIYNTMTGQPTTTTNALYDTMKGYLDITQHIDYTLLHFYIGHQDWGSVKNWYA